MFISFIRRTAAAGIAAAVLTIGVAPGASATVDMAGNDPSVAPVTPLGVHEALCERDLLPSFFCQ